MNKSWKQHPVTKNNNGTFNVIHTGSAGTHPYNVCPKDIDPMGIYDVDEVAALWESLPDGDPRKQEEVIEEEAAGES